MFNLKIAQNKQILEEKYNVPQEFSIELEQILASLKSNTGLRSFILKKIRQTQPTKESMEEIRNLVKEQTKEEISEIDKTINNLTDNVNYRKWIKNLFETKQIQEEDFVKVKKLLKSFTKLIKNKKIPEDKRDINLFKNDKELNEYVNKFVQKASSNLENIKSGYKILDEDDQVTLLQVTEEDTLKKICDVGYKINWCVLTGSWANYPPPEFYLFLINGKPEVLAHKQSNQIKDINDAPIQNGIFINLINPFVEKYNLNTHNGDFRIYDQKLRKIQEFQANKNNEEYINKELELDPMNIVLLEEDSWGKYIDIVAKHVGNLNFNNIPFDLLDYLANYCKIKKLDKEFQELETNMIGKLLTGDNFARYNKIVPDVLKTNEVSGEYKEILEKIDKGIEVNGEPPHFARSWAENILNEEKAPQKWLDAIDKYIEREGHSTKFAIKYCMKRLAEGNVPQAWINGIAKVIKENGIVTTFATNWVIEQFDTGKINETILDAVMERISEFNEVPNVAMGWVSRQMEKFKQSHNINDINEKLRSAINKFIDVTGYPQKFANEYASILLKNNQTPESWQDGINTYFMRNEYPPKFAEEWYTNKLNSDKLPENVLEKIYEIIRENGEPPAFAEEWCLNKLNSRNPPKKLIDSIIYFMSNTKNNAVARIPKFAVSFLVEQLEQNKNSDISKATLNLLTSILLDTAEFPHWAEEICKQMVNNGEAPKEWLEYSNKLVANGYVSAFAQDLYKNN